MKWTHECGGATTLALLTKPDSGMLLGAALLCTSCGASETKLLPDASSTAAVETPPAPRRAPVTKEVMLQALRQASWNSSQVRRQLGLSKSYYYVLFKRFGLRRIKRASQ